jgi:replicative DNA helicase
MLNNLPSERLVLGGIFQHGIEALADVATIVDIATFSNEKNQQIYLCLKTCLENSNSVDIPSFFSAATKLGLDKVMSEPKNIEHLDSIRNTKVNLDNVHTHAKTIRRLQYARELQDTLKTSYKAVDAVTGGETLSEIQSLAESPIQLLSLKYQHNVENKPELIGSDIYEVVKNLEDNPNTLRGISTGFPTYDMMIGGGLNRQCVDVFAARKKEGKSILADTTIAYNIASKGIPVLVLDTEMKKDEQQYRLLSKLARVNINEISQAQYVGDLSKKERVARAADVVAKLPITYAKCNGKKFMDMISDIRRWLLQTVRYDGNGRLNDCVVIYDYFKITNISEIGQMKEYQVLGYQMSALKDFCGEFDFPVLTLVQSNRDGVDTEDSTIVARSDAIMDTATSLTIYKSKTQEEIAEDGGIRNGNKKLVGVMYRHGPGLENDYVNLRFEGEFSNIVELGTRNAMLKPGFVSNIEKNEF